MFLPDESTGFHDVIFDVCGKSLSHEELVSLWSKLPQNIQSLAKEWGFNDTEFRGKLYDWVKKNSFT